MTFQIYRSANSDTFNAIIGSTAVESLSGYAGSTPLGAAWVEESPDLACSTWGPYNLSFSNMEREFGSTWAVATMNTLSYNNTCNVTNPVFSAGSYDIDKS